MPLPYALSAPTNAARTSPYQQGGPFYNRFSPYQQMYAGTQQRTGAGLPF